MNNIVLGAVVISLAVGGYLVYSNNFTNIESEIAERKAELSSDDSLLDEPENTSLENGPTVKPISHASMVLTWGDSTIYVDPVGEAEQYTNLLAPSIVLLTDIHGDHLSVETLENIVAGDTVIVAPQAVYDELSETLTALTTVLANDDTVELNGISITGVPMYNVPESDDAYHTKGRGNGYVLKSGDTQVYIAGDTGNTPEMRTLADIDMAFVPMNLPYTMTVDDAAEAVLAFAPKTVIPYHYRGPDGLSDVEMFKNTVESGNADIDVLLLNWYPEAVEEVEEEVEEAVE